MPSFVKSKQAALSTSSATAFYTTPAVRVATIRKAVVFNSDSSDRTIDIWIANDGGAAADANKLVTEVVAAGKSFFPNLPGKALPQGGKLYAAIDSGTSVTLDLSFSETTQQEDAEV